MFMIAGLLSFGYVSAQDVTKSQLEGKWMLKMINNRNVYELFTNRTPYLTFNFDIEQVSGNSGCNTYNGKFNYSGGKFEAPNITSGNVACDGSSDEALFISLLNKSSKLSILNGELIFSQDDKPVLIFYRAKPLASADLAGVWKLQSIDGKNVQSDYADKIPTLEFNFVDSKLSGSAGCNNYNTVFTLSNDVLDIKPLVTTRMACDNLDGETKFVNAFTGRVDLELHNNVLVLRKDNQEVMTFVK